jgi:hypothetical protein
MPSLDASWDESVTMNKKDLSECDICSKFIGPIREEVAFTKGRIIVRGGDNLIGA